ncbi:TPA: hypothetical protein ACW71T_000376 [Klebsiella aerogenes]
MNNELTAALLTIEKCRELSGCPAGVDLQDWVKQLAAERDEALNAERIWEKTMMEVCGEDGPASVASEIRSLQALRDTAMQALKSQVGQLAAENAFILQLMHEQAGCFNSALIEGFQELVMESGSEGLIDVYQRRLQPAIQCVPPTPATDRIVAGIKADGVEQYAALFADTVNMEREYNQQFHKGTLWFSKQLREGADK